MENYDLLDLKTLKELTKIKQSIINSKLFPKSLTGACNVTSILVQNCLVKNGYNSILVNNHKHCFCLVSFNDIQYVIDLTASQISKKYFENFIIIKPLDEMIFLANKTIKGRGFYSTKKVKNNFFCMGDLKSVMFADPKQHPNDDKSLFQRLKTLVKITNIKVNINIDINFKNVNKLSKEIINKLNMEYSYN